VLGFKVADQFLAQIVGQFQIRRAFQQQSQPFALFFIQLFRITAKQPHPSFERFLLFFVQVGFQFALRFDPQLVSAIAIVHRHVNTVGHDPRLRQDILTALAQASYPEDVQIHITGQHKANGALKKQFKRRNATKPVIGPEKQDHGLGRNHLKGQ